MRKRTMTLITRLWTILCLCMLIFFSYLAYLLLGGGYA